MKKRDFLTLSGLGPENLSRIVNKSLAIARMQEDGRRPLANKFVGIYFRRSSTRTRTSFTVGALRLGAHTIHYSPNDMQLITGETFEDTGRILSGFLDALVVRTNDSIHEMEALAAQGRMAVINAMSENEHPTQAIADLVTIREAIGQFDDVNVMYIGEGNNSAAALALAIAQTPGMKLTLVTPETYGISRNILHEARSLAQKNGASVEQIHNLDQLPRNVDVVYTTRWLTMGVQKPDPNWMEKFEPYRVTGKLMKYVSKSSGTIFMHDLPAVRGAEVMTEVLDGPQSVAFRQAENKLPSAMAVLSWCLGCY